MPEIPAAVLRNKGVPITLYRLDDSGRAIPKDPDIEAEDAEGGFVTERRWIRFTAAQCASIEEAWDRIPFLILVPTVTMVDGEAIVVGEHQEERIFVGIDAWMRSLSEKSHTTMIRTLAILLGEEEEVTGARMILDQMFEYDNAIGMAWAMANGLDPSVASQVLAQDDSTVGEAKKAMGEATLLALREARAGSGGARSSSAGSARRARSGAGASGAPSTNSGG